ncbi:MAG: hypothetical protein WDN26_24325 [Chitinophagaceae bacterium]
MPKHICFLLAICSTQFAAAQVQVKYEPRHHNVFENEYVRILDVHFKPKDTTQYHIHSTPSVFVSFTKTLTTSQLMGQAPSRSSISATGRPSYDSLGTPRIHRVWNDDSSWFHVMDIELTGGKPRSNEPVLQHQSLALVFNRFLATGYNVQLKAGESLQLPPPAIGYLLVSHGDADINYTINNSTEKRLMKAGHYIWVQAGTAFTLTAGNSSAAFMLLQLK